jgi:cell division protein FtsA
LNTKELVLQPLASASAVMDTMNLDAGVAILDIGGGTSDIAIFHDGILKHTAVIPYGGENITDDIKKGLGVMKTQAEAMKVQFGSALPESVSNNAYINIPSMRGLPAKDISVKNLAMIINARMTEILEMVAFEINKVGMDARKLNGGLVLTGGGSQLKHLIHLTQLTTGLTARIGLPNEHLAPNHVDELKKPMYATCIGLILKGFNDYENQNKDFTNTFNKLKTKDIASAFIDTSKVVVEEIVVNTTNTTEATDDKPIDTTDRKDQLLQKGKQGKQKKKSFWETFKGGFLDFLNDGEDDTPLNS